MANVISNALDAKKNFGIVLCIKIPAKRVLKFRVSKAANDAVLGTKYLQSIL